jgi:hypothetical protein
MNITTANIYDFCPHFDEYLAEVRSNVEAFAFLLGYYKALLRA